MNRIMGYGGFGTATAVRRVVLYSRAMASTLTKLLVHVVFSTKRREPRIAEAFAGSLYAYMGGVCRANDSPALAIGGVADHCHMLISMSKSITLSGLMMNVKRDSSLWVKQHDRAFAWQDGYAGFSIGASQVRDVNRYIADQAEHHRTRTYEEELRVLLQRYEVEFEEEFLLD